MPAHTLVLRKVPSTSQQQSHHVVGQLPLQAFEMACHGDTLQHEPHPEASIRVVWQREASQAGAGSRDHCGDSSCQQASAQLLLPGSPQLPCQPAEAGQQQVQRAPAAWPQLSALQDSVFLGWGSLNLHPQTWRQAAGLRVPQLPCPASRSLAEADAAHPCSTICQHSVKHATDQLLILLHLAPCDVASAGLVTSGEA